MKPGNRFLKIVEWSEEDGCYVGTCPGLMLGGIHGDDEAKVYAELCQAVEEWIAIHKQDGRPLPPPTAGKDYSGKFVVRVGKELHQELAVHALYEGVSLNTYCAKVLREGRAPYGSDGHAQAHKRRAVTDEDTEDYLLRNSPKFWRLIASRRAQAAAGQVRHYPNLPAHQQGGQRLADEFNAAEREWERKRPAKPRRKARPSKRKRVKAIGFKST